MTDETQSTVATTEVIAKNDQSSEIASLISLVKTQIEVGTGLQKQVSDLASTVASLKKDNPVANAPENSIAPKVSDPVDVGASVTIGNTYVENTQASIVAPAGQTSATDKDGLKLENKSDKDKEAEEKDDMKKSGDYKYEVVKAIRPEIFNKNVDEIPNGYQIIKAVGSGYGGKYTNAQDVLTHTLEKMFAGDFERQPVGAY